MGLSIEEAAGTLSQIFFQVKFKLSKMVSPWKGISYHISLENCWKNLVGQLKSPFWLVK